MIDHRHYTYRVTWDPDEGDFVAHCSEFPGYPVARDSPEEALAAIMQGTRGDLEEMQRQGKVPPQPFSERRYSGVVTVRVPPLVHRMLATLADEQRLSLNRLIAAILARNLGGDAVPPSPL